MPSEISPKYLLFWIQISQNQTQIEWQLIKSTWSHPLFPHNHDFTLQSAQIGKSEQPQVFQKENLIIPLKIPIFSQLPKYEFFQ